MNNLRTDIESLKQYSFEMGPIRPPSEGGNRSLLIRATRNCPWNRCGFCNTYGKKKFSIRRFEEIQKDIDSAKELAHRIKEIIVKVGDVNLAARLIENLYDRPLSEDELKNWISIVNVFGWLHNGSRTIFLQDADSLVNPDLLKVVKYLQEKFPSLGRITSYARSKTLSLKDPGVLKELREAGLSRLHVGLESGDDEVLKFAHKGVTSREHIIGGVKAKKAGFELSEYVMPGLGGKKWKQHAINTAKTLNEINPDFIRLRPFIPLVGTPLFEEHESGRFHLTSPHERLREIGLMIEHLNVKSRLCFDHSIMNSWYGDKGIPLFKLDYSGYKLPEEKETVLKLIERGLALDESVHIHAGELTRLQHL